MTEVKVPDSLPWYDGSINEFGIRDSDGLCVAEPLRLSDSAYIVHACNAYPKLVEALRPFASIEPTDVRDGDYDGDLVLKKEQFLRARAALESAGLKP